MIENLDEVVVAEEQKNTDFSELIPNGNYTVVIMEIGDWKSTVKKSLTLKPSGEKVTDVTIYNANVKMKIISGDYEGRWLFDNVTTHPNIPWSVPGFVHALGAEKIKLSELKTLEGRSCKVSVKKASYTRTNKETGLDEEVEKNEVTRYTRLELNDDYEADLDI